MSTYSTDVLKSFAGQFQTIPRLFFSPGRINLIGEHIDYNDGFVMPAAIDKGVWFAVAPNNSDDLNFYSHDLQEAYSVTRFEVKPKEGWQNYVLGVVDQIQKKDLPLGGFDCAFGGNLPVGSGMSSSAAVECGLLFALNQIFNLTLSTLDMALMAQKAEHTFPRVMCGIMDQYANLFGKLNHVILLNCKTLEHQYYPLVLKDYSIVLINSKVHHSLASGEYNVRRQQCHEGFKILQANLDGVNSFQDIRPAQVEQLKDKFDSKVYNRCLYVTQEIERTQKAAEHLKNSELDAFGRLMYETHHGLSHLYEVSCIELDFLVEHAAREASIVGSRLMGGGFGGCTINLIHKHDWASVVDNITAAYQEEFDIEAEVYEVATSDGTYEAV
jgi:galactokinase